MVTEETDGSPTYISQELSLLAFNERVLSYALDEKIPLLERLRYLIICSSNMDEFFEVRVARLLQLTRYGDETRKHDKRVPSEILKEIFDASHRLIEEQYRILNQVLLPELEKENIRILKRNTWTEEQSAWVSRFFRREIMPVITPVALDHAHPMPRLVNKRLHFIVSLTGKDAFGRQADMAVVHAPSTLPRVIKLPNNLCDKGGDNFVFLSAIMHANAQDLFPGMEANGWHQFRLTRNSELFVDEEQIEDLALALKSELISRHFGEAVRLELSHRCPDKIAQFLLKKFKLSESQLYLVNGPVNVSRLGELPDAILRDDLNFIPHEPKLQINLKHFDYFASIDNKDMLLHHPYDSFDAVLLLLRQAAQDPCVTTIKQTLYRTGENSAIIQCLVDAAQAGKEVCAVVELRARFDEEVNLHAADMLQKAGVLVVYGVANYKTHAKMTLILRREGNKLKRYTHLGTGNYHSANSKLYTDWGLMSADKDLCEDVHKVFLQLTGMSKSFRLKKLLQSPFNLCKKLGDLIGQEVEHAKNGEPAHIIIKVNALTEESLINQLYSASQAGVKIDLIVRGICCLRPGVPEISENIKVRSVIGRFLEHSRIFYFYNNKNEILYLSSADWMERNMSRRIEVAFPIENPKHIIRIKKEGLMNYLDDNCQSWIMQNDGSYKRNHARKGATVKSAQELQLPDNARIFMEPSQESNTGN